MASRKANPALIGAFVLGAIALAVVAVLLFGSGRFFKKTTRWVIYFVRRSQASASAHR